MTSSTYRLPAELEKRLRETRADLIQPPADEFVNSGRLNMGPAILLATTLSASCWMIIFGLGIKLFH